MNCFGTQLSHLRDSSIGRRQESAQAMTASAVQAMHDRAHDASLGGWDLEAIPSQKVEIPFDASRIESSLIPAESNKHDLGSDEKSWRQLFCQTSPIILSDIRSKTDIEHIDAKLALEFISNLHSIRYKYKEGTSGQMHAGWSAQNVRQTMKTVFAEQGGEDYCRAWTKSSNGQLGLRVDEISALQCAAIKHLCTELKATSTMYQIQREKIKALEETCAQLAKEIEQLKTAKAVLTTPQSTDSRRSPSEVLRKNLATQQHHGVTTQKNKGSKK